MAAFAIFALACSGEANRRNKAGVSHMILGAVKEAIVEFDGAIGADSNMDIAYHNRGQANFRLGRFETVKNDYGQAESLYAGSSLFKTKLGDAYLSLGQHEPVI